MGTYEWSAMAGGPVFIYLFRTVPAAYFDFRIETLNARLKDQQTQRAKTIQKLKDATKYDSTYELLQKYGGGEGKPKGRKKTLEGGDDNEGKGAQGKKPRQSIGTPNRTNFAPPPTANIPRGNTMPLSGTGTPQPGTGPSNAPRQQQPPHHVEIAEEFAPNAFDSSTGRIAGGQYDISGGAGGLQSHWYDRVMDLLLGEDETAAKNRIVLVCSKCRLVNGQAPPGTKSLSELGMWKCMGCGSMNGEMDEGKRIMKEVLGTGGRPSIGTDDDASDIRDEDSSDLVEVEKDDESEDNEVPVKQEESSLKKRKGKGKK